MAIKKEKLMSNLRQIIKESKNNENPIIIDLLNKIQQNYSQNLNRYSKNVYELNTIFKGGKLVQWVKILEFIFNQHFVTRKDIFDKFFNNNDDTKTFNDLQIMTSHNSLYAALRKAGLINYNNLHEIYCTQLAEQLLKALNLI
jgi:hypothetical protein